MGQPRLLLAGVYSLSANHIYAECIRPLGVGTLDYPERPLKPWGFSNSALPLRNGS
jgi:hypothetical protein